MEYELINPHDNYGFEAPDDAIADAVVVLLGEMYGWRRENESSMPAFMISAEAGEALVTRLKSLMSERTNELIAALRSVEIDGGRRKRLGVDPEKWHDEHRSSLADLRTVAIRMAVSLESGALTRG